MNPCCRQPQPDGDPASYCALERPFLQGLLHDLGIWAVGQLGVGLDCVLGRRVGDRLGIITYHRVSRRADGAPGPTSNVTPERFREHVAGLLTRGFVICRLSEVLRWRAERMAVPPRTVVLTFDDGFESVYTNAWPVLRQLQVPATVFLATAYLDAAGPFPFDPWGVAYQDRVPAETYRPLRTAQCQEMVADGLIELGAHTDTHQDFRGRPEDFKQDVRASVEVLRTRFGQREVMFAFPYGSCYLGFVDQRLREAARQAGVVCGLNMQSMAVDLVGDPLGWGRFGVFPWDTSRTLAAKLNGWYAWAPHTRQRIAQWICGGDRQSSRWTHDPAQAEQTQWSP
jgi:peptidoglycan/xylan/chitin deacetylase (PgdA/CDA1 family)